VQRCSRKTLLRMGSCVVDKPKMQRNKNKNSTAGLCVSEDTAATKIQAAFRGSQSRKRLKAVRKKAIFRNFEELIAASKAWQINCSLPEKASYPVRPDGSAFVTSCHRFVRSHATAVHLPAFVRGFRALLEAQVGQPQVMAWRVRPTILTRSVKGEGALHRWATDAVDLMAMCSLWRKASFAPSKTIDKEKVCDSTEVARKLGATVSSPIRFRWSSTGEKTALGHAGWVETVMRPVPTFSDLGAEIPSSNDCMLDNWLVWSMDPRVNDNDISAALIELEGISSFSSEGRDPLKELSGETFAAHYPGQPFREVSSGTAPEFNSRVLGEDCDWTHAKVRNCCADLF